MKKFSLKLSMLLFFITLTNVYSQQTLTTINSWNAYVHLPWDYNLNPTKTYPTIIFMPGLGEVGTNASQVISNGPGAYITQGWNGGLKIGTDSVHFIVISLQPSAAWPNEISINTRIQTIKSLYRVDNNRLHLTGMSMGGWASTTFVTGDAFGGPYTYADQIATVVEVEGVKPDDNLPYPNLFDNFALSGGRLLGFEQTLDNRDIPTRVNRMNSTVPNSGIFVSTNYGGGGHCCWEQFYGGSGHTPNVFLLDGINQNIYEWMARNPLPSAANNPPTANAGSNKTITLPTTTVTLNGSATDTDGTIASYAWTKQSGGVATLTGATTPTLNLSGLVAGTYVFRLTATDNLGATGISDATVTVNSGSSCHCDKTLLANNSGGSTFYYTSNSVGAMPGDTVCIPAGVYSQLNLKGFHGTLGNPIVFINCGGQVEFTCSGSYGMVMSECSNFVFTGTGDASFPYGFKVGTPANPTTGVGFAPGKKCTDFEIDHLEIQYTSVGIFSKTNPECGDSLTWYPNFTMQNIKIHDNYVHHIDGEGFYIGHTFKTDLPSCSLYQVEPVHMKNVEIYNNRIEHTNWDGLQISRIESGANIHHNIIKDYGRYNFGSQNLGLLFGGNCQGEAHHNYVDYGPNISMQILGVGNVNIYNNILLNAGYDTTGQIIATNVDGIYVNSGPALPTAPKLRLNIMNNTIVTYQRSGIGLHDYNNNGDSMFVFNNILCDPKINNVFSYLAADNNIKYKTRNNLNYATIANANFVNAANSDYHLSSSSSAIDGGINTGMYGIADDFDGINRPQGLAYDVGAFEKVVVITDLKKNTVNESDISIFPNPTKGLLIVEYNQADEIKIINTLGLTVYQLKIDGLAEGRKAIDLTHLANGMYMVVVLNGNDILSNKIILSK